jgi:hypothetical protein
MHMTQTSRRSGHSTTPRHVSRRLVTGLLAAMWSLSPSLAHASLLSPEAEDTMAKYIAIFALTFVPIALIALLEDRAQAPPSTG